MFKWIEKLVNKEFKSVELPEVKNPLPTPSVVKNVSEPVLSFVETVKANPKRFKVELINGPYERSKYPTRSVKITDKYTKESWTSTSGARFIAVGVILHELYKGPEYLNQDELGYLWEELTPIFQRRESKYTDLKIRKERDRLTKIYTGDKS